MKVYLLLGLALSAATGCGSSYDVVKEPAPDKFSFDQMNEQAKDQSFTITTLQGEEISATDLLVGGDSTTFLPASAASAGTRRSISTTTVGTITIDNAGSGAIDGLLWGVGVGTPIGLLLSAAAAELEDNGATFDGQVIAVSVGLSAAIGAGIGALIRHSNHYVFPSPSDSSQAKH